MHQPAIRRQNGGYRFIEDPIRICEPQADWPQRYRAEARRLGLRLERHGLYEVRIEHFGSTSVPGLAAKPIIDIMLLPPPGCDWGRLRAPLAECGYLLRHDTLQPPRMFFVKGRLPGAQARTHHVHVLTLSEAEKHLMFRDHLRCHPADVEAYARLKRHMASQYALDREAYTRGKDDFFARTLCRFLGSESRHVSGFDQGGPQPQGYGGRQ